MSQLQLTELIMSTCNSCYCDPCSCNTCTTCGCDTCDGDCSDPKYAPIKECVPNMIKPAYALGLDCDRRKRTIANKVKSILTSDGKTVKFRDGSEEDRIALNLVEAAYASGIITADGSGQLQVTTPVKDGTDFWYGFVENVLGFHEAPDNGNRFAADTVETRNCGSLALIICGSDGYAKLAKFEGCGEGTFPLGINQDGEVVCIEEEVAETVEDTKLDCKAGILVPRFLAAPILGYENWPGVAYPASDGVSGNSGSGSLAIPSILPDHDKIVRLILYVEVATWHNASGKNVDTWVTVNSERILYVTGSSDQWGSSQSPGIGGGSNEGTVTHPGGSTAPWALGTNTANSFRWKLRIYVKGAYYDHCDYAHIAESE